MLFMEASFAAIRLQRLIDPYVSLTDVRIWPNADVATRLGIRPLSEAKGHPADILGPEHRLTITLQGEGARYFNPAVDIALPTTQGISAVACPPTAAATQPSDNAV